MTCVKMILPWRLEEEPEDPLRDLALEFLAERADLMGVMDERGRLLWANEGFQRRTGYSLSEAQGCRPRELLAGPRSDPAKEAIMARCYAHGVAFEYDLINHRRDGSVMQVNLAVRPIRDRRGRLRRFLAVGKEIAALGGPEAQARVGHALRTPLNAILGFTDLLAGSALDPEQRGYVSNLHEAGQALVRAVDSLTGAAPDHLVQVPRAVPGRCGPPRVLAVDDNPMNLQLARRMVEKLGGQATLAGGGLEAVELCQRDEFDLVLMDCQMPDLDGQAATVRIRADELLRGGVRRTPIVALTASLVPGEEQRCLQSGMDGYMSKPLRLQVLQEALLRFCA